MRVNQGAGGDPSLRGSGEAETAFEFVAEAGEALAKDIPGANVLAWLGKKAGGFVKQRLEHTALGNWLASAAGNRDALELRVKTAQDIHPTLASRLNQDLSEHLPQRSYKACRAVVFLDTFEAMNFGLHSDIQQHLREAWVRDLCANLDSVFFVLAGQNRLTWEEVDSGWSDPSCLEQHLMGGLSEKDACAFLTKCGVTGAALQDVILASCKEVDPSSGAERPKIGYHCFSLGSHVNIASGEIAQGHTPDPASFALRPGDWDALSARFLKSLPDDGWRVWIERLALPPRFDEPAGRAAWSAVDDVAQDAAWGSLLHYSFITPLLKPAWYALRPQMRKGHCHFEGFWADGMLNECLETRTVVIASRKKSSRIACGSTIGLR